MELLAAMERLSPLERAAYVLRVVLARPYPEVADVLGRRLPAVRQLVRRARVHLGDAATRDPADAPVMRSSSAGSLRPVGRVARCPRRGSGAGRRPAERRGPRGPVRAGPVVGRDRVARSVVAVLRRLPRGALADVETFNGATGVVLRMCQAPVCVLAVRVDTDHVASILLVANPRKLTALNARVAPTAIV